MLPVHGNHWMWKFFENVFCLLSQWVYYIVLHSVYCTLRFEALVALQGLAMDWVLLGFCFCCDIQPQFCPLHILSGLDLVSLITGLCLVFVSGKICFLSNSLCTISHGEMPRSNPSSFHIFHLSCNPSFEKTLLHWLRGYTMLINLPLLSLHLINWAWP